MEELFHKYWYVAIGAVVVLLLVLKKGSSNAGLNVTQVGSATDTAQLAAIDASQAADDNQTQTSMLSSLLNWDLGVKSLNAQQALQFDSNNKAVQVAQIQATNNQSIATLEAETNKTVAQTTANANLELAKLAASTTASQTQAAADAAAAQLAAQTAQANANANMQAAQLAIQEKAQQAAIKSQNTSNWLGAITSGLNTFLPLVFGDKSNNKTKSVNTIFSGQSNNNPYVYF